VDSPPSVLVARRMPDDLFSGGRLPHLSHTGPVGGWGDEFSPEAVSAPRILGERDLAGLGHATKDLTGWWAELLDAAPRCPHPVSGWRRCPCGGGIKRWNAKVRPLEAVQKSTTRRSPAASRRMVRTGAGQSPLRQFRVSRRGSEGAPTISQHTRRRPQCPWCPCSPAATTTSCCCRHLAVCVEDRCSTLFERLEWGRCAPAARQSRPAQRRACTAAVGPPFLSDTVRRP